MRAAAAEQAAKFRLFEEEARKDAEAGAGLEKRNIREFGEFGAQRGADEDSGLHIRAARQLGDDIAQVGWARTGAGRQAIDE